MSVLAEHAQRFLWRRISTEIATMHPKGVNKVPTTEKLTEVTSCTVLEKTS